MRLEPSDPDIETVVTRIERGDLDLQPEFQRGEVWTKAKKQRLVDSILRDWHIPPIHVIELRESRRQEVLDGQQRLAAIRDFVHGEFPVDGAIEPHDPKIQAIGGIKFRDLPDDWKRQFNQFTLRIFRIIDYKSDEPGELFFRLNQPTSLTSAEQRNAFFGPVRAQVKDLVGLLELRGVDKGMLGFSNARMAYHDVVARAALTVERNNLSSKVTAADLIERYRSEEPLSKETVRLLRGAIDLFGGTREQLQGRVRFNKATIYSWFLFVIRCSAIGKDKFDSTLLGELLSRFERERDLGSLIGNVSDNNLLTEVMRIYTDRSAARVADVSSVILRDAAIWVHFENFLAVIGNTTFPIQNAGVAKIHRAAESIAAPLEDDAFARALSAQGWGTLV